MDYKWKDHYFQKAREHGFKSRAAFKLIEIEQKHRILKRGRKVLDLGSAPGSWLQSACNSVGDRGFVWGVDKVKFDFPGRKNVEIILLDIEDESEREKLPRVMGSKVDVIISDIAPKLTGIPDTDNVRIFDLADIVLKICETVLKTGGDFLIKVFQADELNDYRSRLKEKFSNVNIVVPKARRRASSEVYILAKGFKDTPLHNN